MQISTLLFLPLFLALFGCAPATTGTIGGATTRASPESHVHATQSASSSIHRERPHARLGKMTHADARVRPTRPWFQPLRR